LVFKKLLFPIWCNVQAAAVAIAARRQHAHGTFFMSKKTASTAAATAFSDATTCSTMQQTEANMLLSPLIHVGLANSCSQTWANPWANRIKGGRFITTNKNKCGTNSCDNVHASTAVRAEAGVAWHFADANRALSHSLRSLYLQSNSPRGKP